MVFGWLTRAKKNDPLKINGGEDQLMESGYAAAAAGRWPEATAIFQRVVNVSPGAAQAWHNLSLALFNTGRTEEAWTAAEQATQLDPAATPIRLNFGNIAAKLGKLDIAEKTFLDLLSAEPQNPAVLRNLGLVQMGQKNFDAAIKSLRDATENDPADLKTALPLARALRLSGQAGEALAYTKNLAAGFPGNPAALKELAYAYSALEQWKDAADAASHALKTAPDDVTVWLLLITLQARRGYPDAVKAILDDALVRHPQEPEILFQLGLYQSDQGNLDQAIAAYHAVLQAQPNHILALLNLAKHALDQADYAEAIAHLQQVLSIDKSNVMALGNLGRIHFELLEYDKALDYLERALTADPNDPAALWRQGLVWRAQGKLEQAWERQDDMRLTDFRLSLPKTDPTHAWLQTDLSDKGLLILREQGIGDEVLFASCYADVIADAAHCKIICESRLLTLFKRSFPNAEFEAVRPNMPVADLPDDKTYKLKCLAGSLPRRYRKNLSDFPKENRYLVPDPDRLVKWRQRLNDLGPSFKVGICWRSGAIDRYRIRMSFYSHIDDWGPVLSLPGISFVNLMYGDCQAELENAETLFGTRIHTWDDLDLKDDIEDVVALIDNLDLVVTTQSAVWNLAGGAGADTLAFIHPHACMGSDRVAWHPSIEVVHKSLGEPWAAVMGRTADRIKQRMALRTGSQTPPVIE